jgi:hypothetical protein
VQENNDDKRYPQETYLERNMRQRIDSIEEHQSLLDQKLSTLNQIFAVAQERATNIETRLVSIEDSLKWIVRLLLGALILSLLGTLISNGGLTVV